MPIDRRRRIVASVGAASATRRPGLGQAIEAAMARAVADAYAEGIADPEVHRELMLAARERVKAEWKAAPAAEG